MSDTMQPITDVLVPLAERLARAKQQRAEVRRERAARYGWSPACQCGDCGDTGITPERGTLCWCDAGTTEQQRRDFEQRWSLVCPRRFLDYRLDRSPNPVAAELARQWLATEPWRTGATLVLSGGTGTGKTGIAVSLMREAFLAGTVPAIVNVPAWLDDQRPDQYRQTSESGKRAMADALRPPLLVLDDLGAEKSTEWVQERIYCLVNGRYEALRSTVVTTNHTSLDALAAAVGQRTVSRLCEGATIVPVSGHDRRLARTVTG